MRMFNLPEPLTMNIIITVVVGSFPVAQKENEPLLKTWMYCHFTHFKKGKLDY